MSEHFVNPVFEEIWKDRYCKNGETYEHNLLRVAEYCSNTEEEKDAFYDVMKRGEFFPGGRTMSNAGIGEKLTLNNCFLAGTKVLTKNGYTNIEDVKVGDMVATEDGSWQPVNEVMRREYVGDIYKLSGASLYDDIYCTPNHQFLTNHGWVRADRLLVDSTRVNPVDRIKIPRVRFNKSYDTVDLADYFTEDENQRLKENGSGQICIEKKCGKNRHNDKIAWMKQTNYVNRYIELTSEFRYFIGRWIGDGSITKYKGKRTPSILQIVFNATTEKDAAMYCKEVGEKYFGLACEWRETNQNVISIRWASELICGFFISEFGEKCDGKHLDKKYLGDIEIAKGIIDSDGFVNTHGGGRLVLKNKDIVEWFRETMFLNGYNTQRIAPTRYENTYSVSWSPSIGNRGLNQSIFKQFHDKKHNVLCEEPSIVDYTLLDGIEIIENQKCEVYNLSVENVHSYCVNGVIAHNCFVAPAVQDSMDDIFAKVALGARTHQRGGGIGYDFSDLRPAGEMTSNDAVASGPVSFMDVFNAQTATILQGNRRGM